MSWISIWFSSRPVISVIAVILRVPSEKRVSCTIMCTADAIISRSAQMGRSAPAIRHMASMRVRASRGVLAWMVAREPS